MNDIKARIKSVSGTMQITKAMELVAISKLRRAKEKVESSRPFFNLLSEAIKTVEGSSDVGSTVWFSPKETGKTLYVVIAGDRGLAGGYNSNVFKLLDSVKAGGEAIYLPIGKKSLDHFRHGGDEVFSDALAYVADVGVGGAFAMAKEICRAYAAGEFSRVELVYTKFVSMMSQSATHTVLLPLAAEKSEKAIDPIWDGEPEELLDEIIPQYVGGVLYSAVCEAVASELSARRMSMNAANKNASEMIDALMLGYNRARQAVITQEITEIVSGAEAL